VQHVEFKPSVSIPDWTDVLLDGHVVGWIEKRDGRKRFEALSGRRVIPMSVMNQIVKELEKGNSP